MDFTDTNQLAVERPTIQMAPLIDIVFLLLIFFMTAFIYEELETEIEIAVPTANQSTEMSRAPGEIIINVTKKGKIIVNQRELSYEELEKMLNRVAEIYKSQPVIIRGDKDSKHEYIIKVLDVCAGANIWNVSFATMKEEKNE